ncbi:hypothetical protein CEXT_422271 [Caerostris extrusa]|uniref:Uncharacterized protein n=1 Tax=Caerostris extrusa TaxID=172846 RepID=A0AAV4U955_CAEEX|nr:hypothetical protein CEXT_422271 [Caerostris extrusa]
MSSAYLITVVNPCSLWTHPESLCCPSQWGEYAISGKYEIPSSAEHDVHYLDCQDNILQDEFPEFAQGDSLRFSFFFSFVLRSVFYRLFLLVHDFLPL